MMRVAVDLDRCASNAICVVEAPDVFDIDDDGIVSILDEHPSDALRMEVESAVLGCPTGAISFDE
jgi:ferredoxin